MDNHIFVFSLNSCNYCVALKDRLKEEEINYTELEINSHREIWEQVVKQTNMNILPTVFVRKGETDDGPVFVPNRDYTSIEELIEKLKIYL
jgi:glutaredoxin